MRKAGRVVRIGEQPLKMIKLRAVTVHKRRAVEMAKTNTTSTSVDNSPGKKDGELDSRTIGAQATEGDDGGLMQGLYADWQTQLYVPVPVLEVRLFSTVLSEGTWLTCETLVGCHPEKRFR